MSKRIETLLKYVLEIRTAQSTTQLELSLVDMDPNEKEERKSPSRMETKGEMPPEDQVE